MRADEARLQEVLRLRKENFDTHGGADTRDARQLVPGRSWAAWSRALGMLLPPLTVADLGCGEGYLTIEAARWAAQVIAVDRSDVVLERAKALAARRRVDNVIWKRGELEKLPIKDATVDVALLSQALHHAASPARAVAEASRITVPGGRVLILDLREHREEWVRAKLGDRTLGFNDGELKRMLVDAGLSDVTRRRRREQGRRPVHRADCRCLEAARRRCDRRDTHEERYQPRATARRKGIVMTTDRTSVLHDLLSRRILVLDGAMGTMIQRHTLTEEDFRGARFASHGHDLQGQQRPADPDAARCHRRHPSRVPGGRQRHHRDQHLQQQRHRAGRLRSRVARLRAELRRREAGARRRR